MMAGCNVVSNVCGIRVYQKELTSCGEGSNGSGRSRCSQKYHHRILQLQQTSCRRRLPAPSTRKV